MIYFYPKSHQKAWLSSEKKQPDELCSWDFVRWVSQSPQGRPTCVWVVDYESGDKVTCGCLESSPELWALVWGSADLWPPPPSSSTAGGPTKSLRAQWRRYRWDCPGVQRNLREPGETVRVSDVAASNTHVNIMKCKKLINFLSNFKTFNRKKNKNESTRYTSHGQTTSRRPFVAR